MLLIPLKSSKFVKQLSINYAEQRDNLKINITILLYLLLVPGFYSAAQQYNNWYFGRNAALDFTNSGSQSGPATLANSAMVSDEAACSISDEDGNLLFYTNGKTVYNKSHEIMLNGDNLGGNISACQIAIVPVPGTDSLFYIFTADAIENSFQDGYRYSLLDIKKDNGKGEVLFKNTLLWASCSERLATARHANGTDIWVITNDNSSNIFRSWLITCSGIQNAAVVSTVGDMLNTSPEMNAGTIKVNPTGDMLCQTHFPLFDEIIRPPNFLQCFDFNSATGSITNPRKISFSDSRYTHCEFSPDGKLIYVSRPYDGKIDQLEITLPTIAAIQASRVELDAPAGYYDIQLAADEKIYCARPSSRLSVINQPNVKGTGCNLVPDQVNLLPGSVFIGLPSHINDFVSGGDLNNGFTYTILDSCAGRVQFNAFTNMPATITWQWDFGDGNVSDLQNPVHSFANPVRVYTVKLKISSSTSCGIVLKSKRLLPGGVTTGNAEFGFVVRCDSGYVRFINTSDNLNNLVGNIRWDFGDGNFSFDVHPLHTYLVPGTYPVKLKIQSGLSCLDDSVSYPVDVKAFTLKTIPDQTIKIGDKVFLSTDNPGASFTWTPDTWLSNAGIRNPVATPLEDITYKVSGISNDGCTSEDSVTIHVLQYNDIYVPSAFTPDNNGKNDIIRPFYSGMYELKEFSIFNRWGQRVFSTSERGAGWDGRINGLLQQPDAYIWILKVIDTKNNVTERKGSFVLIR